MNNDLDVLKRLLEKRYSCREFLETPVYKTTIEEIVSTAQDPLMV